MKTGDSVVLTGFKCHVPPLWKFWRWKQRAMAKAWNAKDDHVCEVMDVVDIPRPSSR